MLLNLDALFWISLECWINLYFCWFILLWF